MAQIDALAKDIVDYLSASTLTSFKIVLSGSRRTAVGRLLKGNWRVVSLPAGLIVFRTTPFELTTSKETDIRKASSTCVWFSFIVRMPPLDLVWFHCHVSSYRGWPDP